MKLLCAQHVQVRKNVLKWLCGKDMSGNEFSLWSNSGSEMFCLHMHTHPLRLLHYSVCVLLSWAQQGKWISLLLRTKYSFSKRLQSFNLIYHWIFQGIKIMFLKESIEKITLDSHSDAKSCLCIVFYWKIKKESLFILI